MLPGLRPRAARHGGRQPGVHRRRGSRVAWRLRTEYVRTIQDSIHRHRIDTERSSTAVARALGGGRAAGEARRRRSGRGALRARTCSRSSASTELASGAADAARASRAGHPAPGAGACSRAAGDREIGRHAVDDCCATRISACAPRRCSTVARRWASIRSRSSSSSATSRTSRSAPGMAAFLASPGPSQNLEAARRILDAMAQSGEPGGARDRPRRARLIALVPGCVHRSARRR